MSYKIVMMSKHEIPINTDELPKVLQAIQTGMPAICKQGIFNPSSYSCVIPDKDREKERQVNEIGVYTGLMIEKPLKDLFPNIRKELEALAVSKNVRSILPGV